MLYTVIPGLSLCMTLLGNNTSGPLINVNVNDSEFDNHYTKYLDAAMILIKAAKYHERLNRSRSEQKDPLTEGEFDPDNSYQEQRDESFSDKEYVQENNSEEQEIGVSGIQPCTSKPIDCEDLLLECGFTESGIYRIWPRSRVETGGDSGFDVYCDMDTDGGGWTVIQRRDEFGSHSNFFYKDWESYKHGFGDLKMDFWLGNDKIFALSNQRPTTLRFDLYDFEGDNGTAQYDNFYLHDENDAYRLHLGDYRGNVGDSFKGHDRCRFSTRDRDNDNSVLQHCATIYKGGWWYNDCHTVNLNGIYYGGEHTTYADGVNWHGWRGFKYSLKKTEMKIRSSKFREKNDADYLFEA